MNLAIIPARGGSKRIPRKNIKEFCGKPMIAWPIEMAIKSGCFDKVIVSTDDEEIKATAIKFGAEVPFIRPQELSDDFVGTRPVINHAINEILKKHPELTNVCCIYATSPLIQAKDLIEANKLLNTNNAEFVISVTKYEFPIQRSVRINPNGRLEALFPDSISARSQDLIEAYHDAGQFYFGKKESFLSNRTVFGPDTLPLVLPSSRVQDIDTMEDWERAEQIFKMINR
jgi:pseudaminic acid cytidylyltransferase